MVDENFSYTCLRSSYVNYHFYVHSEKLIYNILLFQEYRVSPFEQRLINEVEYRLERTPPVNEDPQDGVFEQVPAGEEKSPFFRNGVGSFKLKESAPMKFICRIAGSPNPKVSLSFSNKHFLPSILLVHFFFNKKYTTINTYLQLYWFKDGKQISKKSQHYFQANEGGGAFSLTIPITCMEDDGNYTALALNPKVQKPKNILL